MLRFCHNKFSSICMPYIIIFLNLTILWFNSQLCIMNTEKMSGSTSNITYDCVNKSCTGNRIMIQHSVDIKDKEACSISYKYKLCKQINILYNTYSSSWFLNQESNVIKQVIVVEWLKINRPNFSVNLTNQLNYKVWMNLMLLLTKRKRSYWQLYLTMSRSRLSKIHLIPQKVMSVLKGMQIQMTQI